jgi:hypothetical protein
MVNDGLRRLGINTWLDENIIRVGDSIIGSITDGLRASQVMAVFLSPAAVNSIWARREWQSFLARQLRGDTITILPILLEKCQIPEILTDIKYGISVRIIMMDLWIFTTYGSNFTIGLVGVYGWIAVLRQLAGTSPAEAWLEAFGCSTTLSHSRTRMAGCSNWRGVFAPKWQSFRELCRTPSGGLMRS